MIDDLQSDILARGLDDLIQLSEIVSVAICDFNVREGDDLFAAVSDCLTALVGQGWAVVGDLDDDAPPLTVIPWSGSAAEIAARAIRDWKRLGRLPDLGEICWLELTPEGCREAEAREPDA